MVQYIKREIKSDQVNNILCLFVDLCLLEL